LALDGKILRRARALHTAKKAQREAAFRQRRQEIYAKLPRIQEIDACLQETILDTIHIALGSEREVNTRLEEIGRKNQTLQAERNALLTQAGFGADYLDETPLCPVCSDTGVDDTAICACIMEIYRALQTEELSSLLNLGEEHFDAFSLDYYDDRTIHPDFGMTARENMSMNYQLCAKYAATFGSNSCNLFLTGDPGLGKTFLSACIAKVVSEGGFSVVYDTAAHVFSRFEEDKFRRGDDPEEVQSDVARYLDCDLLIVDDLGTEMTTSFVVSVLYHLINTRLLKKKKTIVSSNYSTEALSGIYTPQILSRLEGEYEVLTFFGQDIRKLKKEQ